MKSKKERKLDPDHVRFGERLRFLRKRAFEEDPSMTLRGLAEKLGIQWSYLQKVETGKVTISERLAVQLAEIFGENPDVLFAYARRIQSDLADIIIEKPWVMPQIMRAARSTPEEVLEKTVLVTTRKVRDGKW